jgi:sortase A
MSNQHLFQTVIIEPEPVPVVPVVAETGPVPLPPEYPLPVPQLSTPEPLPEIIIPLPSPEPFTVYADQTPPPKEIILTPPVKKKSRLLKLLPAVFITFGSIIIANVVWPIVSYQLFTSPSLENKALIMPISHQDVVVFSPINPNPAAPQPVAGSEINYTNPATWFPAAHASDNQVSKITHYTINIPKVNIVDAIVQIGGEDLAKSLIQYPGTANPGKLGSPVIFGHSVLRQFYNPSPNNTRRYLSMFSKIMTLQNGDEIIVDFDGITYKYVVTDKFEVKPEDVYILEQRYDNKELKLVTCVPEGTFLRRGVIVAQLVDFAN